MLSSYAIVVIALFAACIVVGIIVGIRNFVYNEVLSASNHRNEPYKKEEYTRGVIKRKGLVKKAEKIMKEAYDYYEAHKDIKFEDKYKIFHRAYKQALELVRDYMDDEEISFVRTLSCYDLDGYSDMYKKFFGYDAYDPYEKVRYILK